MKIIWLPKAQSSFKNIADYLIENWTEKEVNKFVGETNKLLETIKNQPKTFVATEKDKDVRKGLVNKHVSLFYKIKPRKKLIELLLFWDNRRNPKKRRY